LTDDLRHWEHSTNNPVCLLARLPQNERVNELKPLVAYYLRRSAERSQIAHTPEVKAVIEKGILQMEEMAQEEFARGDIEGVLCLINSGARLDFVIDNAQMLKQRGLLERALLDAWTGANSNIRHWSLSFTRSMFGSFADRERLLAAGQPLPGEGPFTLYRGVAGHGRRGEFVAFLGLPLLREPGGLLLSSTQSDSIFQIPAYIPPPSKKSTFLPTAMGGRKKNFLCSCHKVIRWSFSKV
jgi:hypothetical protein